MDKIVSAQKRNHPYHLNDLQVLQYIVWTKMVKAKPEVLVKAEAKQNLAVAIMAGEERLIRGDMTNDATKNFVASLLYLPIVSQKRRIITRVMHEKI
jgi:hypothetical protein